MKYLFALTVFINVISCTHLKYFPGKAPETFYDGEAKFDETGVWGHSFNQELGYPKGLEILFRLENSECILSDISNKRVGVVQLFRNGNLQEAIELYNRGYRGLGCSEILGYAEKSGKFDSLAIRLDTPKKIQIDLWIAYGGGK